MTYIGIKIKKMHNLNKIFLPFIYGLISVKRHS